MSVAVFANFRIDTEERLQRMKDSFESFKNTEISQWVINVRGVYKRAALDYLVMQLGSYLIQFDLNSERGWIFDSRQMFERISCDHVFFWIEDHICMCGSEKLNKVFADVAALNVDYIGYSWFGMGRFLNQFKRLNATESETITSYKYDLAANSIRQTDALADIGQYSYIVSVCGIFSKDFFKKILYCNRPRLRRWPKETPFDFEKRWDDVFLLPINYSVPKFELFSAIDDDNVFPGSSLFSRGLYPIRVSRSDMLLKREKDHAMTAFISVRKSLVRFKLLRNAWYFFRRIGYHF